MGIGNKMADMCLIFRHRQLLSGDFKSPILNLLICNQQEHICFG